MEENDRPRGMGSLIKTGVLFLLAASLLTIGPAAALAQDAEELGKELANPISSLISVPFHNNYQQEIGPTRAGTKIFTNLQPVIPFSLNDEWNLISRTIAPVVLSQRDISPGSGDQSGMGDTTESLFFSPRAPGPGGIIWGAGPIVQLRTGTDRRLTSGKWGIGPTAVVLTQESGWTVGALTNHIWSFAGDPGTPDVNATFLQPFLAYTTKGSTTFTLQSESTYNWQTQQWSIPIVGLVSQVLKIGDQSLSVGAGIIRWMDGPASGPHGWAARASLTFLFPVGK